LLVDPGLKLLKVVSKCICPSRDIWIISRAVISGMERGGGLERLKRHKKMAKFVRTSFMDGPITENTREGN